MSLRIRGTGSLIFKPEKVLAAEKRASKATLSKMGAFVRTRARTQHLRRRKRTSEPGEGPSVHSRDKYANLRNIRFQVNKDATEVVVGPLKITRGGRVRPVTGTVPSVLEHGGMVAIKKDRSTRGKRLVVVQVEKRPFMAKAFRDVLPMFAKELKGKVKE